MTSEDMSMLSSILSDCVVKSISRSIRDLRNDFDATMVSRKFFFEPLYCVYSKKCQQTKRQICDVLNAHILCV